MSRRAIAASICFLVLIVVNSKFVDVLPLAVAILASNSRLTPGLASGSPSELEAEPLLHRRQFHAADDAEVDDDGDNGVVALVSSEAELLAAFTDASVHAAG